MSALDDVIGTPAPLTREAAFSLLSAARSAYYARASSALTKIEVLTFGQNANGTLSRFDTAYQNAQYTNDFFIDVLSWNYAQKATRELAALAGVVGEEGVDTAVGAVKQLGADVATGTKEIIGNVGDSIPYLALGLVALAIIVVIK